MVCFNLTVSTSPHSPCKHNFNGYLIVHGNCFWSVLVICEDAKEDIWHSFLWKLSILDQSCSNHEIFLHMVLGDTPVRWSVSKKTLRRQPSRPFPTQSDSRLPQHFWKALLPLGPIEFILWQTFILWIYRSHLSKYFVHCIMHSWNVFVCSLKCPSSAREDRKAHGVGEIYKKCLGGRWEKKYLNHFFN